MHFFVPASSERSKETPLLENDSFEIDAEPIRESAFLTPEVHNGLHSGHFCRGTSPPSPPYPGLSRSISPTTAREYLLKEEDPGSLRERLGGELPLRLQRRNSPTQAQVAGSLEELRRISADCQLGAACQAHESSILRDFGLASFAIFMSCTCAVAMGAVLFPPAWNCRAIGMRLGLLSMAVSNVIIAWTSEGPHHVGGLCDTVVPILHDFLLSIKGQQPQSLVATAMVGIPFITLVTGVATFAAGSLGLGSMVEACPDVVFNGFIAGTGAQLLEFGLNMMLSSFDSLLSEDSWRALFTSDGLLLCGPGCASAIFVFLTPRYYPQVDTFLLPLTVAVMFVLFYLGVLLSRASLADARAGGWLFEIEVPDKLDFYKVWTEQHPSAARWSDLCTFRFLQTTLQVVGVGLLTAFKNVYGTREVTKAHVDINAEIRSTGLVTLACGALGGLPSGLCMSFSVTLHALGAHSKRFSWIMAAMAVFLMVTGDFLVALLPKMVPACVVLWIGLVLLIFYAWDPLGEISTADHTIIIVMILSDLLWGCGPMILIGLALTMLFRGVSMAWHTVAPSLRHLTFQRAQDGGEYEMNKFVI
mmetsp:Transcript_49054/g.116714  ORF Transcript_49054/g.116714 Transcript_49054/m.116714 type:complete len:588 (+) Transcript_49054:161-1924(+)